MKIYRGRDRAIELARLEAAAGRRAVVVEDAIGDYYLEAAPVRGTKTILDLKPARRST